MREKVLMWQLLSTESSHCSPHVPADVSKAEVVEYAVESLPCSWVAT